MQRTHHHLNSTIPGETPIYYQRSPAPEVGERKKIVECAEYHAMPRQPREKSWDKRRISRAAGLAECRDASRGCDILFSSLAAARVERESLLLATLCVARDDGASSSPSVSSSSTTTAAAVLARDKPEKNRCADAEGLRRAGYHGRVGPCFG